MCEHERHLANSNACRGKKASTMFFAAHTYTFSVFSAEAYSLASHVQTPPFRETIDCYDATFSLVQRHAARTRSKFIHFRLAKVLTATTRLFLLYRGMQHVLAASVFIFAWQRHSSASNTQAPTYVSTFCKSRVSTATTVMYQQQ